MYRTPVVFTEDKLCLAEAPEGSLLLPAVIPLSGDRANLLRIGEDGLVLTSADVISGENDNILRAGAAGVYGDMTRAVHEDDGVLSVSDNRVRATLTVGLTSEGELELRGVDNKLIDSVRLPVVPGLPLVVEYLENVTPAPGSVVVGAPQNYTGDYLHMRFELSDGATQDVFINFRKIFNLKAGDGLTVAPSGVLAVRPAAGGGVIAGEAGVSVSQDYIRAVASDASGNTGVPLPGGGLVTDQATGMLRLDCTVVRECVRGDADLAEALAAPDGGVIAGTDGRLRVDWLVLEPSVQSTVDGAVAPVQSQVTAVASVASSAQTAAITAQGTADAALTAAGTALEKAEQALAQEPDLSGYLPTSGGTMRGPINFATGMPEDSGQASLSYTDDSDGTFSDTTLTLTVEDGKYAFRAWVESLGSGPVFLQRLYVPGDVEFRKSGGLLWFGWDADKESYDLADYLWEGYVRLSGWTRNYQDITDYGGLNIWLPRGHLFRFTDGFQPSGGSSPTGFNPQLLLPAFDEEPDDSAALYYGFVKDKFLAKNAPILTALEETATEAQGTAEAAQTLAESVNEVVNAAGNAGQIGAGIPYVSDPDLNDMTTQGHWFAALLTGEEKNQPAVFSSQVLLDVFNYSQTGYVVQKITNPVTGQILARRKSHSGGGWSGWVKADKEALDILAAAQASGQIGATAYYNDPDMNTLTADGRYMVLTASGHAKHQPGKYNITAALDVYSATDHVCQVLTFPQNGMVWMRRRSSGAWTAWDAACGTSNSLTIYVSKDGSDFNTGLEAEYPVASVDRALRVARGLIQGGATSALYLRFGPGDWGSVTFYGLPFVIYMFSQDGAAADEYSGNLPVFASVNADFGTRLTMRGIVITGQLKAQCHSFVTWDKGYKRVGSIYVILGATLLLTGENAPRNVLEFMQQEGVANCIYADSGGSIIFNKYNRVRLGENINAAVFLAVGALGAVVCNGDSLIAEDSACTLTGKKFLLYAGGQFSTYGNAAGGGYPSLTGGLPAVLGNLPGAQAGECRLGAVINGCPVGFAASAEATAVAQASVASVEIMDEPMTFSLPDIDNSMQSE